MRIGILSDAHGHESAFDKAIDVLEREGCERLFYLGDCVGYVPSAGVLHRLRDNPGISVVQGNHDHLAAKGGVPKDREAVYRFGDILPALDDDDIAFLANLPETLERNIATARCLFIHGSPSDPVFGYVYPDTDLSEFSTENWDVVFMGNTHRPFVREFGGTTFINVGSCGLPRDQIAQGAACIFDGASRQAEIIRFSIGDSARKIRLRFDVHPSVATYLDRCIDWDD